MASNDRRSMGLRRLAKMLFTYRMPGFLSESRQPESTRLVPMWPGMRLRLIDSFPGQPCASREREGEGTGQAQRFFLKRPSPPRDAIGVVASARFARATLPRCGRGAGDARNNNDAGIHLEFQFGRAPEREVVTPQPHFGGLLISR